MVKVGDVAPDFSLKDQSGKIVKLSSFKGKKEVVLFFYPKGESFVEVRDSLLRWSIVEKVKKRHKVFIPLRCLHSIIRS